MANNPDNDEKTKPRSIHISSDENELTTRVWRLRNKWAVAGFIYELGPEWAESAIDPKDNQFWTQEAFLECYCEDKADN